VIGSISSGTVVFGEDEPTTITRPDYFDDVMGAEEATGEEEPNPISSLWVRVHRFQAKEPAGVSEIKRDIGSGGVMYCLRRNALGYGLYEVDVEPLDGPLIHLPNDLSYELRGDAQRANAERNEDVSLTWKLLSAFESVQKLFAGISAPGNEAGGVNRDMRPAVKRRPEEAFEVKQREQLKKAAGVLKGLTRRIITRGNAYAPEEDLTLNLPSEVRGPFFRLRAGLRAAAAALPGTEESEEPAGQQDVVEGCAADLENFAQNCDRIEKSGPWPELSYEVRQEVVSFSRQHAGALEACARHMQKISRSMSLDSSLAISPKMSSRREGMLSNRSSTGLASPLKARGNPGADAPRSPLVDLASPSHTKVTSPTPANGASVGLPLLMPPPAPTCSLSETTYSVTV